MICGERERGFRRVDGKRPVVGYYGLLRRGSWQRGSGGF